MALERKDTKADQGRSLTKVKVGLEADREVGTASRHTGTLTDCLFPARRTAGLRMVCLGCGVKNLCIRPWKGRSCSRAPASNMVLPKPSSPCLPFTFPLFLSLSSFPSLPFPFFLSLSSSQLSSFPFLPLPVFLSLSSNQLSSFPCLSLSSFPFLTLSFPCLSLSFPFFLSLFFFPFPFLLSLPFSSFPFSSLSLSFPFSPWTRNDGGGRFCSGQWVSYGLVIVRCRDSVQQEDNPTQVVSHLISHLPFFLFFFSSFLVF